jgi:hypothetical protein
MVGGVALAVLLAASVHYVYRWFADSPLVADKAGESGNRVATGIVAEPAASPDAGAPIGPAPPALATPAIALPPPTTGVPAVRPGTVVPGEARGPTTAAVAGVPGEARGPTTAAVAGSAGSNAPQRRSGTEVKDTSPGTAPAAPAAIARPRTVEAGAAFELQRPRVGPCTEAVAALGLCTREPAQGRE